MAQEQRTSQSPVRTEKGVEQSGGTLQPRHLRSLSPFQMMRRMTEEMDRAFERFFDNVGFGALAGRADLSPMRAVAWTPRIEAFQKGDQFIVRAELPGLKKDDIEVNVTEDAITIQGERQQEEERREEGFYHSERSYGSFYRSIPLPEGVITDSAKASFNNGVLEVQLQAPPHEVSRGRKVEIQEGKS
ncbi:MAG TPA: Hsp20/alpha crystallin family protein [Vicinamibacterales bacterium]